MNVSMLALDRTAEKQLVEQARSGERGAIGRLLYFYRPLIIGHIKSQVENFADIDDLVQEVCIKVFRFITHFKQHANFKTWLYRITQTTVLNYYRSQRYKGLEIMYEDERDPHNGTPEEEVIRVELSEQITSFLLSLPRKNQQCFYLYSVLGLAYEEIATRMNCPLGTVRSRIHRIRSMILIILQ